MSFANLGLQAKLLRAVETQAYRRPTPIQTQAIPVVLEGRDILAGAQTGTGKTAAFTLPILQLLNGRPRRTQGKSHPPRALVLTPTRELAAQVAASVDTYGAHLALRSAVIFGGVNINAQKDVLRRGVDILVATPGRLLDHVSQGTVDLTGVEILVLDEADRMLDMGFIHDIRKVLACLPKERQNLLFSATYTSAVRKLANGLLQRPATIEVARRNTAAETVRQHVYRVDKGAKRALLIHLIGEGRWHQVLVFTRTKHGANRLAGQLNKAGVEAAAIHGNKSQNARTQALASFKKGGVRVLVATDIAARGLDIDRLPHVVNYELPNVAEDYVHRIGRTGRAGEKGAAVSLVAPDEIKLLNEVQRLLRKDIRVLPLPAFQTRESASKQVPERERENPGRRNAAEEARPRSTVCTARPHERGGGSTPNNAAVGRRKRRSSKRSRQASATRGQVLR